MLLLYDWVVPDFILWDIYGISGEWFSRETYSVDVLGTPYPEGMFSGG